MPGIGFSTSASISWHRYHSGKRTGIFMAAAFTGRYFLLPPFFHGNYSGLYDAGDPSDHGTGTVSQSAKQHVRLCAVCRRCFLDLCIL